MPLPVLSLGSYISTFTDFPPTVGTSGSPPYPYFHTTGSDMKKLGMAHTFTSDGSLELLALKDEGNEILSYVVSHRPTRRKSSHCRLRYLGLPNR